MSRQRFEFGLDLSTIDPAPSPARIESILLDTCERFKGKPVTVSLLKDLETAITGALCDVGLAQPVVDRLVRAGMDALKETLS